MIIKIVIEIVIIIAIAIVIAIEIPDVFLDEISAQDRNEKPAREEPVKKQTQKSDQRKLFLGFVF